MKTFLTFVLLGTFALIAHRSKAQPSDVFDSIQNMHNSPYFAGEPVSKETAVWLDSLMMKPDSAKEDSLKFSSYRSVTDNRPVRAREGMQYFVLADSAKENFIVQIVHPDGKITHGQEYFNPPTLRVFRTACDAEREIFLLDWSNSYRQGEVWEETPVVDMGEYTGHLYRPDYVICTEND